MRLSLPRSKKSRLATAGVAALVVVVPTAVVVAQPAASTSTASVSASVPAARTAAVADPAKLLTTADLGPGWTELSTDQLQGAAANLRGKVSGVSVSPRRCVRGMSIPAGYRGEVHRVFKLGSAMYGPYLATAIAVFASPKAAKKALNQGVARARGCQLVQITANIGSVSAQVSDLRTARLGDQRVGYQIDATVMGFVPVQGQIIVVRKGNAIVAVAQGGIGVDTAASTKSAAAIAASRL